MGSAFGSFADWPDFAFRHLAESPASPKVPTVPRFRQHIGVPAAGTPLNARVERAWERDGVAGEEISWSVGYGPRTRAWLLWPATATRPLPGVLAFHGHDDFKILGKEKIADGPTDDQTPGLDAIRAGYGGRAFANVLAARGFAVLVPDVFLWGSRRFDEESIRESLRSASHLEWLTRRLDREDLHRPPSPVESARTYNNLASLHEDIVEKTCRALGTSLAGMIAYEDEIALSYLRSRTDRCQGPIAAIGSSGGGARAALLGATSPGVDIVAITCMMSSYREMIDRHIATHTWMLFPPHLSAGSDWPDIALSRAPAPLVVQYALDDELFPVDGMRAAHRRIAARYEALGRAGSYAGQFYPGGHRFDRAMQEAVFQELDRFLQAANPPR